MLIEIYYKDPDAGAEAASSAIQKKYPDIKPYTQEYWDKHKEFTKNLIEIFGGLAGGAEDLCIDIDTDKPGTISVNGSKYRLVTQEETR